MKIAVIGGGPAGLYFALLKKKAAPDDEITVFERNPRDATFGWGVVFSEETLGALRDADDETYTAIGAGFARWSAIDIFYRETCTRSSGHVFTGISRKLLLAILQRRCAELGVRLVFQQEILDLAALGDGWDLVVGADGINGMVRRLHADVFKPSVAVHRSRYIWFGTDLALDAFTFIFRRNQHGLFQVHAYPFDARTSTFIVECPEEVWRSAGLDHASETDSIAYCEQLFSTELQRHHLLSNRSQWLTFSTLRTETWHHGGVVLLGDAAHTAHFSIGSGTKLAMEDAIGLVNALRRRTDLEAALTEYETERQPVVERFQEAARESAGYFEEVSRYLAFEPEQFAFNLLTRSRRITHATLAVRDPRFVSRVDAWFARTAAPAAPVGRRLAPPPMFTPLELGSLTLANRVVVSAAPLDGAAEGLVGEDAIRDAGTAGAWGSGLLITELTAPSAEGRLTCGSPGIYRPEHVRAWARLVEAVHDRGGRIALQLGHAGRRGSTRPRAVGLDRPLRQGGWRLVAASPIPFTPRGIVPREMVGRDMERVTREFAGAARAALSCDFDLLEVNFAQGYLLAGFLSPLSNRRTDGHGGSLENRLRFPLRVLEAVRGTWPAGRPLAVRLTATDRATGGLTIEDAVTIAAALKARGVDLIHAVLGQTVAEERPEYGRMFGVQAADRIRNEAGIRTIASGHLTTADEVNTILASGRADLCVLDAF